MSDLKTVAKAIFLEALEYQGDDELTRFLEQACGTDLDLRARVEELMRAHRDNGLSKARKESSSRTRSLGVNFLCARQKVNRTVSM